MISKTDYMIPGTFPEVTATSLMGPDDWKTIRDLTQHLELYTDGFRTVEGVGEGLYCTDPETRLSYKLPSDCSIFQAEDFAIRKAAEVAQNINRHRNVFLYFVFSKYVRLINTELKFKFFFVL